MRLIDADCVSKKIPFAKATILNWAYGRKPPPPGFPAPVKVSNKLVWVEDDLEAWIVSMSIIGVQPQHAISTTAVTVKRGRGRPRKTKGDAK